MLIYTHKQKMQQQKCWLLSAVGNGEIFRADSHKSANTTGCY